MNAMRRVCVCLALAALAVGCAQGGGESVAIQSFPIDGTSAVPTGAPVVLDTDVSSDGNGSFRIDAQGDVTVPLFRVDGIDIEDATLIYRAQVRAENVEGQAYLEMWCVFDGKGEYFSRALKAPLSGTADWTQQETPFFLQKGENPDAVKLNIVVQGTGTVWVDDISLLKGPLE